MATRFVHRGTELESALIEQRDRAGNKVQTWVGGCVTKVTERYKTYARVYVKWECYDEPVPIDLWNCDFNNKDGVTPWRFPSETHNETVESLLHAVDMINYRLKDMLELYDKMITPEREDVTTDSDDDDFDDETLSISSASEQTESETEPETDSDDESESPVAEDAESKTGASTTPQDSDTHLSVVCHRYHHDPDDSIFQPAHILVALTAILTGLRLYEFFSGIKI